MPVHHIAPVPWSGRNDPEDGEEAVRLHHLAGDSGTRALLGFACDAGVVRNKGRPGARQGPQAIRTALANLAAPPRAKPFADLGDIAVEGDDLETGQSALADKISDALKSYQRLVVLGGGHETAFGSYCGLAKAYPDKRIGIVNLDAHFDLRLVGPDGPSSGTPFSQIREYDPARFDYLCLGIADESNSQALVTRAKNWGVATVSDHALIADSSAADREIEAIIARNDLIYLTIDIDVLPHFQAPGVSAPAARGVPLATIEHIIGYLLAQCTASETLCPLADIVETCPAHDLQSVTSKTAAFMVRRLLFS